MVQHGLCDPPAFSKLQVNPRGLFITASLIVAFHPEVLTKYDRVYIVQCYYMEMEKILERELMVK